VSRQIAVGMSRAELLDHIAHVMRDRAYPEFTQAPLPLWATDAAETVLAFFESKVRETLASDERLLSAAFRWINWFEEPTMEVRDAWIARTKVVLATGASE
jgi:hypothetical protein